MKVAMAQAGCALLSMVLLGGSGSLAQSPDRRLLALVPPDSQLVAGTVAPQDERHRGSFLIFTRANILDIEDFFAIAGADATHEIDQVIFAASAGRGGSPEHSLLVSGHFDADRVEKFPASKSSAHEYHGIRVVVVQPFVRERAFIRDDRLLAIIDSHLAMFGTTASVQQEIDRYLSGATADAGIMQELNSLRSRYETWCLISSLALGEDVSRILRSLDREFGEIDKNSDTLLFGIRYGRQIEFEYVVDAHPKPIAGPGSGPGSGSPGEGFFEASSDGLGPASNSSATTFRGSRRILKISRTRYGNWLAGLTAH